MPPNSAILRAFAKLITVTVLVFFGCRPTKGKLQPKTKKCHRKIKVHSNLLPFGRLMIPKGALPNRHLSKKHRTFKEFSQSVCLAQFPSVANPPSWATGVKSMGGDSLSL
jgi:hypothetical protein